MTAHPTLSLVEQLYTAGAVGTVPLAQADGSLSMQVVGAATGFVDRTESTLTWTDSTPDRTLSVQPTGASFDYFMAGVKYTSTGDTVQITNVEGVHWIYYDGAVLTAVANPTKAQLDAIIIDKTLVSVVYWDLSAGAAIYVGEERHGYRMSPQTHDYLHFTEGLRWLSGVGLNTINADAAGVTADAQFGVDAGNVTDEDLLLTIGAIGSTTGLPIYYMTGAGGDWHKYVEAGFSVRTYDGTNATRLAWNEFTGGAWQLSEAQSGRYVLCHVLATTEKDSPMVAIMGQNEYLNRPLAQAGAATEIESLVLEDLLLPEIRPVATVIFQTNLAYTSDVNARIVSTVEGADFVDWRSETISRSVVTTTDHQSLTGRLEDGHPQYSLVDGTRAFTGTVEMPALGIGTSTVPHGGIGAGIVAIDGSDVSTTGPHAQFTTAIDDYPLLQILNWRHDAVHLAFDCYYDGSWRSSDAGSNFKITKGNDVLRIDYDSAIAAGSTVTWNNGLVLDTSGDLQIFGLLQFGGQTNTEPALKRNANSLHIVLADDSGFANLQCSYVYAQHLTANVTNGFVRAGATGHFYFQGRTELRSPLDGNLLLQNAAEDDFGLLQFGDTDATAPGLKRVGAALHARLADDTGYASWSCGSIGIGTDTIPHGGVGQAKFAIDGPNTSADGPHVQYTTDTDDYPVFSQFNWGHDNVALCFDSYYQSGWMSSDAGSNFLLYKVNDQLEIRYDSSISAGSSLSWNKAFALDTSGLIGLGGDPTTAKVSIIGSADTEQLVVKAHSAQTNANPLLQFQDSSGTPILDLSSDGSQNIFLGVGCGVSNTTGVSSCYMGANSGSANISGGSNVGIGVNSLANNTTGGSMVAVGVAALLSHDSANAGSVAIGYACLREESSGYYNCGLGYYAGRYNQTGIANVSVGTFAAAGISGNSFTANTAIGYGALRYVTTGSSNTVLGQVAGDNITSGDFNIIIGAAIDAPSATGDYQLNIGDLLTGDMSAKTAAVNGTMTIIGQSDTEQLIIKAHSAQTLANPLFQLQNSSGTPLLDITSNDPTNVIMGVGAGVSITTAPYMVCIGGNAAANQTINGSNVAIGFNALYSCSVGSKVVAIGQTAMQNFLGSNAVGIGYAAGKFQTGGQCVYIGRESGLGVSGTSTGENHTCVGYMTGKALTTAEDCSLFGYQAGIDLASTTCSLSSAFGSYALNNMANGVCCTAIGSYAMRLQASGDHNVALGYDAAGRMVGGEHNVNLGNFCGRGVASNSYSEGTHTGYAAGIALTTGSGNCLYGMRAGDNLTSGSYNLILGYDIQASSATGDYQLDIGGAIKGDLSVGDVAITRHLEIDGDLNHDGSNIGFFATAVTGQATALTSALTQITHTGPTTPDYAIATPVSSGAGATWGFSTQDEFETIMAVVLNLQTRVDELESKLQAYGLLQ